MVVLKVEGKFVSSYSVEGIQLTLATRQWEKKLNNIALCSMLSRSRCRRSSTIGNLRTATSSAPLLVAVYKVLRSVVQEVVSFGV
jgi:hypothetical protein